MLKFLTNYLIKKTKNNKVFCLFFLFLSSMILSSEIISQNFEKVNILIVVSGDYTNNTLFRVNSTYKSLKFIRAKCIEGNDKGFFTKKGNQIRYHSAARTSGIPDNKSKIQFEFLKSDGKTPISPTNFKFVINDLDGPNNEAVAIHCDDNLRLMGASNPTNLIVDYKSPYLLAEGQIIEKEGIASSVMFVFIEVSTVEFDSYGNNKFYKDFYLNNKFNIKNKVEIDCNPESLDALTLKSDFIKNSNKLYINASPVYFDRDKYSIRKDAEFQLISAVRVLKKYPKILIQLQSHTDSRNTAEYNLKLSNQRANEVKNWIVNKGISVERITSIGLGESQLVNKCSDNVKCTEKEHQENRRTEFLILNPEVINTPL